MSKYYVTATDKFMSGWGMAEGKINKLVFLCDNLEEANIVVANCESRSDFKNVSMRSTKPSYGSRYYTQFKDKDEYPNFYKRGYFSK